MYLPIFQLTWGYNGDNFGLVFPSELPYETQSFVYCLPVPVGYINGRPIYDQIDDGLDSSEYYFPCESAGEYIELPGEVSYQKADSIPIISFEWSNGDKISFGIDLYRVRSFYRKKDIHVKYIDQYIGKHRHYLFDNLVFIILEPRDIPKMNRLFLERKAVFVGYTPDFGVFKAE